MHCDSRNPGVQTDEAEMRKQCLQGTKAYALGCCSALPPFPPRRLLACRLKRSTDAFHMAVIGATAAAHNVDLWKAVQNFCVLSTKLRGIASIELRCVV